MGNNIATDTSVLAVKDPSSLPSPSSTTQKKEENLKGLIAGTQDPASLPLSVSATTDNIISTKATSLQPLSSSSSSSSSSPPSSSPSSSSSKTPRTPKTLSSSPTTPRKKQLLSWKTKIGCILIANGCKGNEMPDFDPPQLEEVDVEFYLTTPDQSSLLETTTSGLFPMGTNSHVTIDVSDANTYQEMDGFGFTLTGGSAMLLNNMSSSARSSLLRELFGNGNDEIGISYLRVSIGSSDLDQTTFSYNDLPSGQTDINLDNFSLNPDVANLIPVLNEILAINPTIQILATPWSPPTWMKSNNSTVGGELSKQYYSTYANYFVKYIQEMTAQGIIIDAITIQNEPENSYNNPSMVMTAEEQKIFIRDHLGPLFATESIETKIILFDHNLDNPDYPISIMNDAAAKAYVDGSAFHLYAGQISNMALVRDAHPDKNVYFTEQWIQAPGDFVSDIRWHVRELMVGAPRNWSKNVLQWNLAADSNSNPHTDGGCTKCLGAITIEGNTVERNPGYYIIAHSSKFVPPGSVRIDSNFLSEFPNVAYKTPDDRTVVVVLNNSDVQNTVNINVSSEPITITLPASSMATFIW